MMFCICRPLSVCVNHHYSLKGLNRPSVTLTQAPTRARKNSLNTPFIETTPLIEPLCPPAHSVPQTQVVPYQAGDCCTGTWKPPFYKAVGSRKPSVPAHLTTSLSWSSLSHIARANGPPQAWLFYEFRNPYQVQVTLFVPIGKLVLQFKSGLPLQSFMHHIVLHTNSS